jgi:hypothetical protein
MTTLRLCFEKWRMHCQLTVNITSDSTVLSQPSFTFGDWIFEVVTPSEFGINLIDSTLVNSSNDFIVSNSCCGGDFTLRRLDNSPFSLLSLLHAGDSVTLVGGVAVNGPGAENFESFNFAGQPGVTNVSSALFSPSRYIQVASFDASTYVPEPSFPALLDWPWGHCGEWRLAPEEEVVYAWWNRLGSDIDTGIKPTR